MIENATDCETDMLDKLYAALSEFDPNPDYNDYIRGSYSFTYSSRQTQ